MRLLRRADFNAGANINTFWRMPCRGALDGGSKKALTWDNKHITWFGKSRLHGERVTSSGHISDCSDLSLAPSAQITGYLYREYITRTEDFCCIAVIVIILVIN